MTTGERGMLKAGCVAAAWFVLATNGWSYLANGKLVPPENAGANEKSGTQAIWGLANLFGGAGFCLLAGGVVVTRPRCGKCDRLLKRGKFCPTCGGERA